MTPNASGGVGLMALDTAEKTRGKSRTRARIRAGKRRWAGAVRMRVALAVTAGAVVLFAVGSLVLGRAALAVRGLERSQYASLATESRVRLDRLIDRDRARLLETAFSDKLYQLAASAPLASDSFIRPDFAERFPLKFGDQFVAIYDMTGATRFRWAANPDLERAVASNGLFRMLDNREPTVGLLRAGDQLIWVGGAPILPTSYSDQTQPIRGYLVVAQPFNPLWIAPSLADRGGRFDLRAMAPPSQPFRTRVDGGAGLETIDVAFALPDIYAQQNTLATLTAPRAEFLAVEAKLRVVLAIAGLAALALAFLAYRAAIRWLVAPAEQLAEALAPVHSGEVPQLVAPVSSASEWTSVTGAVNRLISNGRGAQDQFERLAGAGTEGLWERDLASGEWIVNPAFRAVLGYREREFASPLAALTARLHPDDAAPLVAWLESRPPSPEHFDADIRVRRSGDSWGLCRFVGRVAGDGADVATRLTGSVTDLAELDASRAAAMDAEERRLAAERAAGRLVAAVANAAVTGTAADRRNSEYIGKAMAGSIVPSPGAFDVYDLLQQTANARPGTELTIVPGVPERVTGDGELIRAALDALADAADSSRIVLRVDQPDRQRPDLLRFLVEHHGLAEADRSRLVAAFAPGHPDGSPQLAALAARHLAAVLGGRAGAEPGDPVSCMITLELPAVPIPVADLPPPAELWDPSATFEIEPRQSAPFKVLDPGAASEPAVELAADETVTLRLDEPTTPPPAISDRFAERLGWRDAVCLGVARTVTANGPGRLADLETALKNHEHRNATEAALDLNRMAAALEAVELEQATRHLVDAIENQYGEGSESELARVQRAWWRVVDALGSAGQPAAKAAPEAIAAPAPAPEPAIDPATLEQLTASLTDGAGLAGQLIGLFLAEGPARVDAIERAAGAADWSGLAAAARDLQGMCGLVGATGLGRRCATAAEASGPAAWAEALAVRAEWKRVHQVLDGLMGARIDA